MGLTALHPLKEDGWITLNITKLILPLCFLPFSLRDLLRPTEARASEPPTKKIKLEPSDLSTEAEVTSLEKPFLASLSSLF